jgi:replicative superfamily II helicase
MSSTSTYVSNAEYVERRSGPNNLITAIDRIVDQAQKLVWIAVPWFYTSSADAWIKSLIEKLAARRKEGLDVRLFVRPDVSNHETVNELNLAEVHVFSKKAIIRHIHTKMVLSESTLLAMTANITDFDLYRNLNTGILSHSLPELEKAKRDFERLVESDVLKRSEFTDVDINHVIPHDAADFFRDKFPKLNPVQVDVAPYVLQRSENLLIGTETGTGKTLMAELAIWNLLSKNERTKALYIAPLRAITSEKEQDWKGFHSAGMPIYKITGDEETVDEEKARKARLILTTGEKWDSLTRKPQRFPFTRHLDLVVLDEVHIIDDETRGPTTEVLLSRIKRTVPKARIIGLSATMRNIEQLAQWINGEYYKNTDYRPVPLTLSFEAIPDTRYYNITEQTKDKIIIDTVQMLLSEQTETGKRGKILIFAGSRRKAEETAFKIADSIRLLETRYVSTATSHRLRQVMEKGAAFVHAGLRQSDRKAAINAFDEGPIDVLVSTTSLAWGVNIAARTVIIRDIRVGMQKEIDFLSLKQMIGRAGRKGKETAAYAIILVPFKERQLVESALIEGRDIESKLERYLLDHINAEINLGTIKDQASLREWFTTTFWYYQNRQNHPEWEKYLAEQLGLLLKEEFLTSDGKRLAATELGKLTSDWYVHVKTAINLIEGLRKFDFHTHGDCDRAELSLLKLLATSEEDFAVVLRSVEEKEEVQEFIDSNPMLAGCGMEAAKVIMLLSKAIKGYDFPEEEYQTVRLAIGLLGYTSALGVLKENYSAYVIGRDLARRLQYHQPRGAGQLLNLIWFSTPNNDEKERTVRSLYNVLNRSGINSPRELKDAIETGELHRTSIQKELLSNATSECPNIATVKLDGKHLGEDIKLLFSGLPEKVTIALAPTGVESGGYLTLHDSNYLSLSRNLPQIAGSVGAKSFHLETLAFNRFGWDYAKILCELLVLPGSWRASVLAELESFLAHIRPEVRVEGFFHRLVRALKRAFSYTSYVNDFVTATPVLEEAAKILTRDSTTAIGKATEIGYFAQKHIAVTEGADEPDPAVNILSKKKTTSLGLSVLTCSLMRSAGLRSSLVEVVGGRFSKHALPVYWEEAHGYVLDLLDEFEFGLKVRSTTARTFEIVQLRIPVCESKETVSHGRLEWVENYIGDRISRYHHAKNFTIEERASAAMPDARIEGELNANVRQRLSPEITGRLSDGTTTRAEYEGRCFRCGRRIKIGDEITWWNPDGAGTHWVHVNCLRHRR